MLRTIITGASLAVVAFTAVIGISTTVDSISLPYWASLLSISITIAAAYAIFSNEEGE